MLTTEQIVERLRTFPLPSQMVCRVAADEIERLRRELETYRELYAEEIEQKNI